MDLPFEDPTSAQEDDILYYLLEPYEPTDARTVDDAGPAPPAASAAGNVDQPRIVDSIENQMRPDDWGQPRRPDLVYQLELKKGVTDVRIDWETPGLLERFLDAQIYAQDRSRVPGSNKKTDIFHFLNVRAPTCIDEDKLKKSIQNRDTTLNGKVEMADKKEQQRAIWETWWKENTEKERRAADEALARRHAAQAHFPYGAPERPGAAGPSSLGQESSRLLPAGDDAQLAGAAAQSGALPGAKRPRGPDSASPGRAHVDEVDAMTAKLAQMFVAQSQRDGFSELHVAARLGDVAGLTLLLDSGADVDALSRDEFTPLHEAIENGHEGAGLLLLERGADPRVERGDGKGSALLCAAAAGTLSLCRKIIERLQDCSRPQEAPNELDATVSSTRFFTALHYAAIGGHTEVCELLVGCGASTGVRNVEDETPLHLAAGRDKAATCAALLVGDARRPLPAGGYGADVRDNQRATPLLAAASQGHLEVCRVLLENGADANAAKVGGLTPLYEAASRGHLEVCRLLLENGADVTAADGRGDTPLHASAFCGRLEVCDLLLGWGARPDAVSRDRGQTPLHKTALFGKLQVCERLIQAGAPIGAVDFEGQTALTLARAQGHAEFCEYLSGMGAAWPGDGGGARAAAVLTATPETSGASGSTSSGGGGANSSGDRTSVDTGGSTSNLIFGAAGAVVDPAIRREGDPVTVQMRARLWEPPPVW